MQTYLHYSVAAERIDNVSTDNPTMQHTGESMQESSKFIP